MLASREEGYVCIGWIERAGTCFLQYLQRASWKINRRAMRYAWRIYFVSFERGRICICIYTEEDGWYIDGRMICYINNVFVNIARGTRMGGELSCVYFESHERISKPELERPAIVHKLSRPLSLLWSLLAMTSLNPPSSLLVLLLMTTSSAGSGMVRDNILV